MISNKKTIWINNQNDEDTYAEFIGSFRKCQPGKIVLKIACEGHFAVYLNGQLAFFGASADYPWYKQYHKKDYRSRHFRCVYCTACSS